MDICNPEEEKESKVRENEVFKTDGFSNYVPMKSQVPGHYFADSGIHSAGGTQTPVHCTKTFSEDLDLGERYQPQNYSTITWSTCPMSVNTGENSLLSPATPSNNSVLGMDSMVDTPIGSHTASSVDLRGNKLPDIDTDEAANAIPELVKLIDDEDDPVIMYQSSMMVFQLSKSEAIDSLINSSEMITCIISALGRTGDPETIRFLSGTLYNISQTQPGLKIGGIKSLLNVIRQPTAKEDILEPCMCALLHLTSRHDAEDAARRMIVQETDGLPIIARILHASTAGISPDLGLCCQPPQYPVISWMLIKALVGLLRNIAVNIDSHYGMRECGLVTGLYLLLYATLDTIVKSSQTFENGAQPKPTIIQGVRLEEIVEGVCGALHLLAKDGATRSYLALFKAPNLASCFNAQPGDPGLSIFGHLLYSPNESIQRAAAGLLVEVSQDRDGLEVLANLPGACQRLEQLTSSPNEAVSTYSSALVMRLVERKNSSSGSSSSPHCLFISQLESLNTPPLPSDIGTSGPIGGHHFDTTYMMMDEDEVRPGNNDSLASWSTSALNESLHLGPDSSNSLTAMLGPPPTLDSTYSTTNGNFLVNNNNCLDPNSSSTIMMDDVDDMGGVYPPSSHTTLNRPLHHFRRPSFARQQQASFDRHSPLLDHAFMSNNTNLQPSSGLLAQTADSCFSSLQTSGYISPNNGGSDIYMDQLPLTGRPSLDGGFSASSLKLEDKPVGQVNNAKAPTDLVSLDDKIGRV